jgi:hypothetical protein
MQMAQPDELVVILTRDEAASLAAGFAAGVKTLGQGPADSEVAPAETVARARAIIADILVADSVMLRLDPQVAQVLHWCWMCGVARASVPIDIGLRSKLAQGNGKMPNAWRPVIMEAEWPEFPRW